MKRITIIPAVILTLLGAIMPRGPKCPYCLAAGALKSH